MAINVESNHRGHSLSHRAPDKATETDVYCGVCKRFLTAQEVIEIFD